MTILAEIMTALNVSGVTDLVGDGFDVDAAPQDQPLPLIVFRRVGHVELMTLLGAEGTQNSEYVFECWAATKEDALELRDAVVAAVEAAAGLTNKYRLPYDGDEYEETLDQFCEPVKYSFWHQ